MSTVGYPPIMSKKSHSKYPQAMPEKAYDAHYPQKSLSIKDCVKSPAGVLAAYMIPRNTRLQKIDTTE